MMNNVNTSLGEDIKRRRKEKKMTQAQLAKAVGVSELSIRNYEKNERSPKFDVLQRLDEVLDLNLDIMQINDNNIESKYDIPEGDYLPADYEPDPSTSYEMEEMVAALSERQEEYGLKKKGIQPDPHRKLFSELPALRDMLTNKKLQTVPEKDAKNIIEQIDQFYKEQPTTESINQEEIVLTHELFESVMQPYQNQGILDIVEVLSFYLMLNSQGKNLVLNILKAIFDSQNLIQKKYDPYDPRPSEGRYSRH